MTAQHDVVSQIEQDVEQDEEQFEGSKLDGALLVTQISEGNALEGIDGHGDKHGPHVGRMVCISHCRAQRTKEQKDKGNEKQRGATHHGQDGGVDLAAVFLFLVDKTEESGFHAEGENHEQQGRVGIHVGDHTVATAGRTDFCCVERHQQIVEESANDA